MEYEGLRSSGFNVQHSTSGQPSSSTTLTRKEATVLELHLKPYKSFLSQKKKVDVAMQVTSRFAVYPMDTEVKLPCMCGSEWRQNRRPHARRVNVQDYRSASWAGPGFGATCPTWTMINMEQENRQVYPTVGFWKWKRWDRPANRHLEVHVWLPNVARGRLEELQL